VPRLPPPPVFGNVRFQVVGTWSANTLRAFGQPWDMEVSRSPSGLYLFEGLVRNPARPGSTRLAEGQDYVVRVTSDFYRPFDTAPAGPPALGAPPQTPLQAARKPEPAGKPDTVHRPIPWPPERPQDGLHELPLEPGYRYPFPPVPRATQTERNAAPWEPPSQEELVPTPSLLRGIVRNETPGRPPVAGAIVRTRGVVSQTDGGEKPEPWRAYRTAENGEFVFVFPDEVFVPPDGGTSVLKQQGPVSGWLAEGVLVVITYPDGWQVLIPNVTVVPRHESFLSDEQLQRAQQSNPRPKPPVFTGPLGVFCESS
jgi:hypothetical protein